MVQNYSANISTILKRKLKYSARAAAAHNVQPTQSFQHVLNYKQKCRLYGMDSIMDLKKRHIFK